MMVVKGGCLGAYEAGGLYTLPGHTELKSIGIAQHGNTKQRVQRLGCARDESQRKPAGLMQADVSARPPTAAPVKSPARASTRLCQFPRKTRLSMALL